METFLFHDLHTSTKDASLNITGFSERRGLLDWADRVRQLVAQRDPHAGAAIQQAIEQFQNDKFLLTVLGQRKRGKSTLVNALLGRRDDFEITLINKENYFVFQPLLAEVVSGNIGLTDMVSPIRQMLKKTDLHVREVEAVDMVNRTVTTSRTCKSVFFNICRIGLTISVNPILPETTSANSGWKTK